MRLVLLGVRGSTPAPGARFLRYGGHTSCIAVLADGDLVPSLVLDAGTGLRELPRLLEGGPFRGAVVLTHLHWDHVQGIPFCSAVDRPDAEVEVHLPGAWDAASGTADARRLMAAVMSPPHFPIAPDELQGAWRFCPARPGAPMAAGGAVLTVAPVAHKGGVTHGIRVELDGATAAYLPDHALTGSKGDPAAEGLVAGVDVLLHDGQFTADERGIAAAYGHATVEDTLLLADRCDVGQVVLVHHAPTRTDEQVDALAARFTATPGGRPVSFARQGQVLHVPASDRARRHPAVQEA